MKDALDDGYAETGSINRNECARNMHRATIGLLNTLGVFHGGRAWTTSNSYYPTMKALDIPRMALGTQKRPNSSSKRWII